MKEVMDGWLLAILTPFQEYFSHIRAGNNKRLCSMEPRLRLKRFPPQTGLEPVTVKSVGQC